MNALVNRTRVLWNAPDVRLRAGLFLIALAAYLRTMAPTVLDGDNAEFQYMAFILGVPHSSGYPLYILLTKLMTFLPIGDVAYRVNLFSVLCAALAISLVYAVAMRVVHARIPALLATLIFAVTPSVWGSAVEVKPYSFHLLLGVLTILFALRWHQEGNRRDFFALAFVYGLGLTNHHVILFLAPALALLVWLHRQQINRAMVARGAVLALLPLLLYAYLPLRADHFIQQQDPENWKLYTRSDAILKGTVTAYYNHTPQGVFALITGLDNSYKLGFKSEEEQTSRTSTALNLLLEQFGFAGAALAAVGAWAAWRRNRREFAFLALAGAGIAFIAIYLRGISTVFYFSLAYFILALWIADGFAALLRWGARVRAESRHAFTRRLAQPRMIGAILALLPLTAFAANFSKLDQSNAYLAREYAQQVLADHLAPNAVVIAPWEVAETLRYLQFVEHQREDLLIVNVSPVQQQFETMRVNARTLNRPFYQIQFNPEDYNAPGPRTVQAIPLPLLQPPQPRYALNKSILDEVNVIGYDFEPDPPEPGKPTRLLIYYRTLGRMFPIYSSYLDVNDLLDRAWLEQSGFPGSFYFPTFRWQPGDIYREAWLFTLPPNAPNGLYHLGLSWYVYDLDTRKTDYSREFSISLGTIRVGATPTLASITRRVDASSARGIAFVGWNADPAPTNDVMMLARGQSLDLDLFWRAEQAIPESYTVFVHLVDSTGKVFADADSPPSRGIFPTDRWTPGEIVRDRHALVIPADLAPGEYEIEIGMYLPSTNQRLAFNRASPNDRIVLTPVQVK